MVGLRQGGEGLPGLGAIPTAWQCLWRDEVLDCWRHVGETPLTFSEQIADTNEIRRADRGESRAQIEKQRFVTKLHMETGFSAIQPRYGWACFCDGSSFSIQIPEQQASLSIPPNLDKSLIQW